MNTANSGDGFAETLHPSDYVLSATYKNGGGRGIHTTLDQALCAFKHLVNIHHAPEGVLLEASIASATGAVIVAYRVNGLNLNEKERG